MHRKWSNKKPILDEKRGCKKSRTYLSGKSTIERKPKLAESKREIFIKKIS
jgi:hypothetical protein